MKKCSICKEEIDEQYTKEGIMFWDKGHNAEPVNKGQCCSMCNDTVVLPTRLYNMINQKRR